ncbi:MAG TPA: 3-phosphoshikimate 1-carboxyvinyltransferase [Candidatus Limnocylindrales bacterium]|nr:3-phosphoshikimate 1-carboxyvinyltransferase [Candidatus Limnocylindrales bacterium]
MTRAPRLRGELRMPGDKSISHRALLLSTLARGESHIVGAGDGEDVRSTAAACIAIGAMVEGRPGSSGTIDYVVRSPGADGLGEPADVLDCGNSGTTLRLSAGILASLPMYAVLDGDALLRRRPVARIIEPLRSMGAVLHARGSDSLPPLTVVGRTPLRAIEYGTPVPSAQVKSAILLAALRAEGVTKVSERVATRDHTERMLRARGVPVETRLDDTGVSVSVAGGATLGPVDEKVPGDVSAAAFWLVAGSAHPDAEIRLPGVGVNPTRRAAIDLLLAMGADITEHRLDAAADDGIGEPRADLVVRSARLTAIDIGPAATAAAIDEIPILCLAATAAHGTTTIRGTSELRLKESDRVAGTVAGLAALGARVEIAGDDIAISGPTALHGAATDSGGDHRLAMTFAIAGLLAGGETTVSGASAAAVSYPGFFHDIEGVRA